jgi:hypothetical protein
MSHSSFGFEHPFYLLDLTRLLYNARKSLPWWKQKTPKNIAKYIWHSEDNLAQYARHLLQSDIRDKVYKAIGLILLEVLIQRAYNAVGKNPDKVARYIWYSHNYEDPIARYVEFLLKKDIRVDNFKSKRELVKRIRENI